MRLSSSLFTLLFLCGILYVRGYTTETVSLSGIIKNAVTNQPLSGATVSLAKHPSITTTTNQNGAYTLQGVVSLLTSVPAINEMNYAQFQNHTLTFAVSSAQEKVSVALYSLSGKRLAVLVDQQLSMGSYSLMPVQKNMPNQVYLIQLQRNAISATFKFVHTRSKGLPGNQLPIVHQQPTVLNRVLSSRAVADTLIITATNYKTKRFAITSYSGTNTLTVTRSDIIQGIVSVSSVSPKGLTRTYSGSLFDTSVYNEPAVRPGFINSGTPDSMIVILKAINVTTNATQKTIWRGRKELVLKGNGVLNLSDMYVDSIPKTQISAISLIFHDRAKICGSLTGRFNVDTSNALDMFETKTFYTKTAFAYNAQDSSGGASAASGRYQAFETAPAQLVDISLMGASDSDTNTSAITTPANFTYDSTKAVPQMTILFDLSRMLRFYNGCNLSHQGGVNPTDPEDRAYFFCHSVFWFSVAAFFGDIGEIQGYQTMYSHISNGTNSGVPGWMTIVCNAQDTIISGILIGDDDNALTIAKGMITSVSLTDTTYALHYNISNVDITGFKKKRVIGDSTFISWHQFAGTGTNASPERFGKARFCLRFKTK